MKDIDWLSLGKLRVGWGILGNNRIDELSRYTTITTQYNYPYGIGNHILYPGAASVTIGNPDIKWEKAETFNVGLDLGFLENSLSMSIEYFNKKTTDMLLRVPTVLSAGLDDTAREQVHRAGAVPDPHRDLNVPGPRHARPFDRRRGSVETPCLRRTAGGFSHPAELLSRHRPDVVEPEFRVSRVDAPACFAGTHEREPRSRVFGHEHGAAGRH